MSWTDGKPFIVDDAKMNGFKHVKRRFGCSLCGDEFKNGDGARWIFANFKASPVRSGNFFVCQKCDGPQEDVLARATLSYKQAVRLAKQWGIYGPDWQRDS